MTGGADDVYAPEIDSAKTFPVNGQTNFTGDRVHLKFKEYITLVKPNDNIIITPRPGITPTYTAHNKTLEILFHEPLAENTTYTINFNRAVADITERNDSIFQYVFSTGSYIDSLAVKGRVTDAFTNRPSADFLVALYPMQNEVQFDSIPYKLKPTYISQTDASGQFRLNYLKYGVYYLFAIHDKNKNLLLDSDEAFAFMPERTILVNNDYAYVSMKSFERESGNAQVEKVNFTAPGKVEILFTAAPDSFDIKTSCELLREETGSRDSLVYWLATNPTPKMRFEVVINGVADTLKPLYKSSPVSIRALLLESNIQEGKIMPDEMLELTFSEPVSLSSINPEGIKILNPDSTFTPVSFELKNLRTLVIADTSGKPVTLVVDSAAVSSVYGAAVQKTQSFTFEKYQSSYYGSLIVTTDSVFTSPCLVYLLNANGESIDTAVYSPRFVFENLVPGDYQLRLVVDEDQNGYWTTGSFQEARIPEKVIYFNETIQVKSKWEKEVDWLLKSSEN
ncbi:MAG: Ig-like domain-containing protein [Bacteroidetes bacterium]|nr:Ig-like domain-containing protein [Bacteroidota bacterium]